MDLLLAALFFLFGSFTGNNTDQPVNFEQIIAATIDFHDQRLAEDPTSPGSQIPPVNGGGSASAKIDPQPDAPVVKGIYMTGSTAGVERFNTLIKLVDETELNAVVLDVKDDYGNMTFEPTDPELLEMGNYIKMMRNVDDVIQTFNDHDIYPIARIVVFKDTVLAAQRPDLSFQYDDGSLYNTGTAKDPVYFVNPYVKEVWDYNIQVAKEAAKHGFKEIQFDYVRFSEGFENKADVLKYAKDERERVDVIADFVQYAREQLNPLGVRVAVDIFGYTTKVEAAYGIGQDFAQISSLVDVISPMIYPSHYGTGWYDQKVPDAAPYEVIDGSMKDAEKKFANIPGAVPINRPWIQDFTATWIPGYINYGKNEVEAQIRALKDNGINEFLLWNSGNVYSPNVNYDLE